MKIIFYFLALLCVSTDRAVGSTATPMSPMDCETYRREAEADARMNPGYAVYARGLSRLLGWCDPMDIDLGAREVERALQADFDDALVVEYVKALSALGELRRAAGWLDRAAVSLLHYSIRFGKPFPDAIGIPVSVAERSEELFTFGGGDSVKLRGIAETFASRAETASRAEAWYLDLALSHLARAEVLESAYIRARAIFGRRLLDVPMEQGYYHLAGAVSCGHPAAARYALASALEGRAVSIDPARLVSAVLRLPDVSANDIAETSRLLSVSGVDPGGLASADRQNTYANADSAECWAYSAGRAGRPPR